MPIYTTQPNLDPSTIFHKEVTFSTVDENTNESITEGYNVFGPSVPFYQAITLVSGKKYVLPLFYGRAGVSGDYYLKFHFPNGTSGNKMYITFCEKNAMMADGYYDYKTGIPTEFRQALETFVRNDIENNVSLSVGSRSINFTVFGTTTNKPSESASFSIIFTYNNVPGGGK